MRPIFFHAARMNVVLCWRVRDDALAVRVVLSQIQLMALAYAPGFVTFHSPVSVWWRLGPIY